MSLHSAFTDSSDGDIPPIDDISSIVCFKQWSKLGNRDARDLSTHSAPPTMGPVYYGGAKVLETRNPFREDSPLLVLSDAQLARRQPEIDHPRKRCAESIAIIFHSTRAPTACVSCEQGHLLNARPLRQKNGTVTLA